MLGPTVSDCAARKHGSNWIEIEELARHALARDFRHIDPRQARILLIEAGPRLLSSFPPSLADYATRELEKLGVTVLLNHPVENVTANGAMVGGKMIAAGTMIWGAGIYLADSQEEAELLATSVQQAFVALRMGQPTQLPPPQAGYADSLPLQARALLESLLSCSAVGTPETARRQVEEFVARTNADELIVTSQIYDFDARIRSYELLSEVVLGREVEPAQ